MIKCDASGCTSTENTEINGKILTLFSFPSYDDSLLKLWIKNSNLNKKDDNDSTKLKLCELHFEPTCFASQENNALAPGAVPTIFDFNNINRKMKREDKHDIKQEKEEEEEEEVEDEEPPLKQRKLKEDDEKFVAAIDPLQSNKIQTASDAVLNNADKTSKSNFSPNITSLSSLQNNVVKQNGGSLSSSAFTRQIDMGKKVYRLIIKIDKVVDKTEIKKDQKVEPKQQQQQQPQQQQKQQTLEIKYPKQNENILKNGVGLTKLCSKTGCKLTKTTLNSKPVFNCERCNKYYIIKENKQDAKDVTCYICQEVLTDPDTLNFHIRKHFTCDMCQAQCTTQISFDKHIRLHVSTDPLLPYKCHKCCDTFEVKADVREHYAVKHSKSTKQDTANTKVLYRCDYCYAVFTKEETYKNHVELHMGDGEFDCSLCSKKFKTSKHLAIHQSKHLNGVNFNCRVCGKEFVNFEELDIHMKIHADNMEIDEHKCNICKKLFQDEASLNNHMRGHLSRAHRCPLCNKAFINKTTLRIHFKTHNKVAGDNAELTTKKKQHSCTLCPIKFESRSQLYNHIMTHLEQMHGVDGGEVVFKDLDELLESDEDILS